MKTLLAIAAVALAGLVFPQNVQAGHANYSSSYTYVSGRSACGCPIYTKRLFSGYDCYRRPIYRYVSVPVVHRCNHRSHYRGQSHYSHSRSHYDRGHSRHHYSSNRNYKHGYRRGYSHGCR